MPADKALIPRLQLLLVAVACSYARSYAKASAPEKGFGS